MKLNLLYFSPTKTTEKIVKAIGKEINEEYIEYDLTMKKDRKDKVVFSEYDLVIIGVPVYGGRIPIFLEDYFTKLKGNKTPIVLVGVYGNRHYDDALLELKNIFLKNGFKIIGAGAFIGEHSFTTKVAKDRPDNKDLDISKKFGIKIKEKLLNKEIGELVIPGNYPYKERKPSTPIAPITNNLCTNCGVCAELCPQEAIDKKDYSVVDGEKCILCNRCVKECPVNAKEFESEGIKKIIKFLEDNFLETRKEPEIFI